MTRREAREEAFTIIFERIFTNDDVKTIVENATEGRNLDIDKFALKLAMDTADYEETANEVIERLSKGWKINRIAKTTIAILRMSICEIDKYDDIPFSVTVNESVEIAKKYSTDDDAQFINGILGAYIKEKQ